MELNNKKILITGASGFIGSHLTEKLLEKGCDVKVFVKYNSGGDIGKLKEIGKEKLERLEIVRGDLRNYEGVKRAVSGAEIVFHLGALISIPYSYTDPRDFVDVNIIGTLNILRACQEEKVKKIVITSSSEVYGTAIYSPIDEKHPLQPQSPYSATKIAADNISESFYHSFNLPITIIRPFNTYGPRQSMRAVIPTIVYQALFREKIELGSLFPKRDFNFVEDVIEGFIKIAESDSSIGKIINIGSGKSISIKELVEKIKEILGKQEMIIEVQEEKIRPENSEVKLLLCDNSKAKEIINWEPKISFEEGLRKVIEYVKDNKDKYLEERGNI